MTAAGGPGIQGFNNHKDFFLMYFRFQTNLRVILILKTEKFPSEVY